MTANRTRAACAALEESTKGSSSSVAGAPLLIFVALTALAFRYWPAVPRSWIVAVTALIAVSLALRLAT